MVDVGAAVSEFRARNEARRMSRLVLDDRVAWIKQAGPAKIGRWNRLHAAITRPLGGMFRSTAVLDPVASLRDEGDRLRRFRAMGLAVPDVLHADHGVLVLADCGVALDFVLKREPDVTERERLLAAAMRVLADFHAHDVCHGRPFAKDMTVKDGAIHFLDLEESPDRLMPLRKAQARDVWLFLQSAARYLASDPDVLSRILAEYRHPARDAVYRDLRRFVRILKPVRFLLRRVLWRFLGKDVRCAVAANLVLEREFARQSIIRPE